MKASGKLPDHQETENLILKDVDNDDHGGGDEQYDDDDEKKCKLTVI